MNRYNQLTYGTLNDLPLPQLPFEQLGQLIGKYQQQKDVFDMQSESDFSSLETESDKALAKQVRDYRENLVSDLSDIYMKGDTKNYMNALRSGIKNLVDLRRPGGAITALESRVQQVSQIKKDLEEQFKDDASKINYKYAISQINPGEVGYDAESRTFNSISKPTVQNFFDVQKRIDEAIKLISPYETKDIEIKDGWVWSNNKKIYNVQEVFDGIMNEPEVREQMRIEAAYARMSMGEEGVSQYVNFQQKKNDAITEKGKEAISLIENKLKSEDEEDVKYAQTILKAYGFYDGAIDGDVGKKTNEAFNKYIEKTEQEVKSSIVPANNENFESIFIKNQEESYFKYFRNMRPDTIIRDIEQADWKAKVDRAAARYEQTMMKLFEPQVSPLVKSANPVTANQIQEGFSNVNESLDTSKSNLTSRIVSINDAAKEAGKQQVFDADLAQNNLELSNRAVFVHQNKNKGEDELTKQYAEKYNVTEEIAGAQIAAFQQKEIISEIQNIRSLSVKADNYQKIMAKRTESFIENASLSDASKIVDNFRIIKKVNTESPFFRNWVFDKTNIRYDTKKGEYYALIPNETLSIEDDKKVYTGVTKEDVEGISMNVQNMKEVLAENPKLKTLLSFSANDMISSKLGNNIESSSFASVKYSSKDFEENEFLDIASDQLVAGSEDNWSDPMTGLPPVWVRDDGKRVTEEDMKNIKKQSVSITNIDGKPAYVVTATSGQGYTMQKMGVVREENLENYNTMISSMANQFFNIGDEVSAREMLKLAKGTDNAEMFAMQETRPDYNKKIKLNFPDTGESSKTFNYEEIESFDFKNKNNEIENYKVIVAQNPQFRGIDNFYKYYLIDGSGNVVGQEQNDALSASFELYVIKHLSQQSSVREPVKYKTENLSAQQLAAIGAKIPSASGTFIGGPLDSTD